MHQQALQLIILPTTGDYVIAVEIKEYRNGNLIGVTRRDLQVLVLSCPPNPAPNIDPTAGTTSNQFTIEEGETLCFDFGYDDPNGDSLTLIASGTVFDVNIVNPNATINQPVTWFRYCFNRVLLDNSLWTSTKLTVSVSSVCNG